MIIGHNKFPTKVSKYRAFVIKRTTFSFEVPVSNINITTHTITHNFIKVQHRKKKLKPIPNLLTMTQ